MSPLFRVSALSHDPTTSPPDYLTTSPPPWHLTGTAVLLLHDWRSVLALVHYDASPVGSYDELALSTVIRCDPTVVEMYVNSQASMIGGRAGWGFPKQMAPLRWERHGPRVVFQAGSRRWRVRSCGPPLAVRAQLWSVQVLDGRKVKVPLRVVGRVRIAFQGRRLALLIESFAMMVLPPLPID
ncbi:MAG TPA: acetoacetate decarboxylase family protein [Abditibacteriaceae bacterium]|nr:acetoacetate decarboxylase family protein [Abditibacteriaceae bacterium]